MCSYFKKDCVRSTAARSTEVGVENAETTGNPLGVISCIGYRSCDLQKRALTKKLFIKGWFGYAPPPSLVLWACYARIDCVVDPANTTDVSSPIRRAKTIPNNHI